MISPVLEAPRLNEPPNGRTNGHFVVTVATPSPSLLAFDDARARVENDDLGKWDVQVRRRDMRLRNGQMEFPLHLDDCSETYSERLELTRWAQGQFCARLGIPAAYFRACPLVLQDQNANYWL